MDQVRIGMVGARYGATVHLQNLAPLRGTRVQVTGICSQSRESAEACARRFDIPFVTTDLAALLDRKDIHALDLCVPTALHHAFAIQAAEAGKHVIVEKLRRLIRASGGPILDEYFTEKLETKAGWSFPSPDEDWLRGYPQEMQDFVDAIRERREPLAGLPLAADCIEVIYSASGHPEPACDEPSSRAQPATTSGEEAEGLRRDVEGCGKRRRCGTGRMLAVQEVRTGCLSDAPRRQPWER